MPIDPGARFGAVHLTVADLDRQVTFYETPVGLTRRLGDQGGAWIASGGYHHHIGANVWAGAGAPPPPPGALGLDQFEIVLNRDLPPSGESVRDPSGNAIRLVDRG